MSFKLLVKSLLQTVTPRAKLLVQPKESQTYKMWSTFLLTSKSPQTPMI